jgi:O-antigen/teichoic acid export membrane protein
MTAEHLSNPVLPAARLNAPGIEAGGASLAEQVLQTLSRWLDRVPRAAWAITDQALFSISNFAMTLLLARWLPSEHEYGAFAVSLSYFYLVGTVHNSVLIEPMLVFGPRHKPSELPQYLSIVALAHFVITLPGALLLAAGGVGCLLIGEKAGGPAMAQALFSTAMASPFILLLWLMRRTCYVRLDPRPAALAGLAYLVLMMGGLAFLYHTQRLSVPLAMLVMALSSLITSIWLARGEGIGSIWPSKALWRTAIHDHAEYGKWAIGSGLVAYIPTNIFFLIIPMLATLGESAALRAMTNLVMPVIQANNAMCVLLLPRLVRQLGTSRFRETIHRSIVIFAGVPLVYWLLLGIFHERVMGLAYHDRYMGSSMLLWIIGLQPVFGGLCAVYQAALECRRRPDLVFWSGLFSAVFCLTGGLWLAEKFGLAGVAATMVLSLAGKWLICWWRERRLAE